MWTSLLDAEIAQHEDEIIALRRDLHAHPEPSGAEHETSRKIFALLSQADIPAFILPSGRGVIADLSTSNINTLNESTPVAPRIALRADIDALRIQEEKQAEYSSRHAHLMHACGHDGHTATLLGAVLGLQQVLQADVLPRAFHVRAIFQPAEETATGAMEMMAAGVLDKVDAILALHLDPSREVGRIGIRYGAFTAACDDVAIHIEGEGGHAARPHESRDPIAAAAQLVNALYSVLPRATDSNDSVVLTIGQIHAGDSSNVIPGEAVLKGTLRTLDPNVRLHSRELIKRVTQGVAQLTDTNIEVTFDTGPPSVVNDAQLSRVLQDAATNLLGENSVDIIQRASMGGEDFAFYLSQVPGAMCRLGCAADERTSYPLHSPHFDIDERALRIGAGLLARAAILWSQEQTV